MNHNPLSQTLHTFKCSRNSKLEKKDFHVHLVNMAYCNMQTVSLIIKHP